MKDPPSGKRTNRRSFPRGTSLAPQTNPPPPKSAELKDPAKKKIGGQKICHEERTLPVVERGGS